MNVIKFPLAIILSLLGFSVTASALESGWVDTGKAKVRLHADAARAAVEIQLLPKWHTYWRYPGDAGIPPRFDWTGSENLASAKVKFPVPRRFKEAGGEVIGYEDRVSFPIDLTRSDTKKPVRLRLKFDFAVCERICIPAEANFSLDVSPDEPKSAMIESAQSAIPMRIPLTALGSVKPASIHRVQLERGPKPRILVDAYIPDDAIPHDLFAEGPTEEWALPLPQTISRKENLTRFAIPVDGAPPGAPPIPSKIRLTLYAGSTALEYELPLD